jgi:hypothetical protein
MVASNSKGQAPFLTYLTVFRSRLGAVNVVLPLASFAFQPSATLSRRLKQQLSAKVSVETTNVANSPLFEYLQEKRLVGSGERKTGRYTSFSLRKDGAHRVVDHAGTPLTSVKIYQTDMWLSDPEVASTNGVPTVDNSDELLELCFQLGLLLRTKSTWTAAGQLTAGLREFTPGLSPNPMVLGLEALALLRQVLERDGLLLREVLRELCTSTVPISRDAVALRLPKMAAQALTSARSLQLPSSLLAEGKRFVALLEQTALKRAQASQAPGVLEHRTSPRLEWLVDFGALNKQGFPRNAFEYNVSPDAQTLLNLLDSTMHSPLWADDTALGYWRMAQHWTALRNCIPSSDVRGALRRGYVLMKRSIGPCAIREVCFTAGILLPGSSMSVNMLSQELLAWASAEPRITLSGGRFTRKPELVHMTDEILNEGY